MKRKDLLFITARTPWPLITGDRIRCYNLLLELSKVFNVTLVVLEETNSSHNLINIVKNIISLKKRSKMQKFFSALTSVSMLKTLQEGVYYRRELRNILNGKKYQVAVFHLLRSLANKSFVSANNFVLDMCDPVSLTYRQIYEARNFLSPWYFISTLEMMLASKREHEILTEFSKVFVHNPRDLEAAGLVSDTTKISTMGITTPKLKPIFERSHLNKKILFIGNIDYVPNHMGLDWFLSNVFPKLPGDYTITIVGSGGRKLKRKYKNDRMNFIGLVDNLGPYLADHGIGIAPMFIASGIQNKVLEYLYCGLGVVCSNKVKLGLLPEYIGSVLACEMDPKMWAEAIINYDYDIVESRRCSNIVKTSHDWARIGRNFIKEIEN